MLMISDDKMVERQKAAMIDQHLAADEVLDKIMTRLTKQDHETLRSALDGYSWLLENLE